MLAIGMPEDVFWNGKPELMFSYLEADRLRQEREEKSRSYYTDYAAWLHGAYNSQAFGVVLANAFSKGRKAKYPAKPTTMKDTERRKPVDDEKLLMSNFAGFSSLVSALNKELRRG